VARLQDGGFGRSSRSWPRRHKVLTGMAAVLLALTAVGAFGDEDPAGDRPTTERPTGERPAGKQPAADGPAADQPSVGSSAVPEDERAGPSRARRATHLVTRVVDGDTIELGNGETVRIVGIDTPERGECGFERATANTERLVLGRHVRLTVSDEDRDRYGRLLRYVDIGGRDVGLRLIRNGNAVARYDSRDGYGHHRREERYVAADAASRDRGCPGPVPALQQPSSGCAAGYRPCVPPYPPDLDCADVTGPVVVDGSDPHRLDADGDGVACEP